MNAYRAMQMLGKQLSDSCHRAGHRQPYRCKRARHALFAVVLLTLNSALGWPVRADTSPSMSVDLIARWFGSFGNQQKAGARGPGPDLLSLAPGARGTVHVIFNGDCQFEAFVRESAGKLKGTSKDGFEFTIELANGGVRLLGAKSASPDSDCIPSEYLGRALLFPAVDQRYGHRFDPMIVPDSAHETCGELHSDSGRDSDDQRGLLDHSNWIENEDFSHANLISRNFRGKVLTGVNFAGANLKSADLTGAVICNSNLSNADLTGAHLDLALIGGGTKLDGANLSHTTGRFLGIDDASYKGARLTDSDWRNARIYCDIGADWASCVDFMEDKLADVSRTDMRGALLGEFCCDTPGLELARFDGASLEAGADQRDFAKLSRSLGVHAGLYLRPYWDHYGAVSAFTKPELLQLPQLIDELQAGVRPSFDCARAALKVEKSICQSGELATLDLALDWTWRHLSRSAKDLADQRAWLRSVRDCSAQGQLIQDVGSAELEGLDACIGRAYVNRIAELAPRLPKSRIADGTYTSDPPVQLPSGDLANLAGKYLAGRGFRVDQLQLSGWGGGNARVQGYSLGNDYNTCQLDWHESEAPAMGAVATLSEAGEFYFICDSSTDNLSGLTDREIGIFLRARCWVVYCIFSAARAALESAEPF